MRILTVIALAATMTACGGGKGNTQSAAAPVNAAVESPEPGPPTLGGVNLDKPVAGFGTEPFWNIEIAPGNIAYTDASAENPQAEPFFPVAPVLGGGKAVYTTRNAKGEPVVITLTAAECLEVGEPEDAEPLTLELRIGDAVRRGCAGPKRALDAEPGNAVADAPGNAAGE